MDLKRWLKCMVGVLYHPIAANNFIKYERDNFTWIPFLIVVILLLPVRLVSLLVTHYPLASVYPQDVNFVLEALKIYVPLFTWIVAVFAVTAILDGESKIREIATASAFSLIPYLLFTLIIAMLSNFMSLNDIGIYTAIIDLLWAWVVILFFLSVMILNAYKFYKTVWIFILSVLTVAVIWGLCMLMYTLIGHFVSFVNELINELQILIRYR